MSSNLTSSPCHRLDQIHRPPAAQRLVRHRAHVGPFRAGLDQREQAGQIGAAALDVFQIPLRHHLVAVVGDQDGVLRDRLRKECAPCLRRDVLAAMVRSEVGDQQVDRQGKSDKTESQREPETRRRGDMATRRMLGRNALRFSVSPRPVSPFRPITASQITPRPTAIHSAQIRYAGM